MTKYNLKSEFHSSHGNRFQLPSDYGLFNYENSRYVWIERLIEVYNGNCRPPADLLKTRIEEKK